MSCDPRCHLPFQPGPQLPLQDSLVAEVGGVQFDGEELLVEARGWPGWFNNAGKRITSEHTLRHHFRTQPFWITSEHKITHLMETPTYTHTHTHQIYWQARDFGRKTRSKATPTQKTSSYENLTRFNHVIKSHACHVKEQSMYKSATPATQNEGRCKKVQRLPQKMKVKIWNKSLVVLDVRRATRPLGFICCCTWCKDCHDTFRVYMLLHLM